MTPSSEQRRPPITPQLAVRVAVLGGLAFVVFGIVFFRLWFLQVLSGDDYLVQARENRVRKIKIEAPRGQIVDRKGTVLVDTRVATAVQIVPPRLPRAGAPRKALYRRLGRVLKMDPRRIQREVISQRRAIPWSNVTLKTDVSRAAYSYLYERQEEFPGVRVQKLYLRDYPHKTLGAQLFGTLREISPGELKEERYRDVAPGTRIGKDGVEETYDRYLRGRDGYLRVQVDALGRPKGEGATREPVQGKRLKLSLDLDLQRAAENAMQTALAAARGNGNPAEAGAYVALDPRNGEVFALGSYPSFDANVFAKPISQRKYKELSSHENGAPLFNRATAAEYPTGSTFKLITALAALDAGLITPFSTINDDGVFQLGPQQFRNARNAVYGTIALARALQVSSDVFFYTLGARANGVSWNPIQRWARRLSLGRPTGIDLPGEADGLVPTPKWVNDAYADYLRCIKRRKLSPGSPQSLVCGGIQDPWTAGDAVNLSVGQGYLQATPLQMAVAYAAVANGGRVVRPHLGLRIEDAAGRLLQEIEPGAKRRVDIDPEHRASILDGLRRAATEPGGTSADVFAGFPKTVYGKTGTVERPGQADQSWYVSYVPDRKRPIVVAVTVEKGGFGAESAAPAARLILSEWFDVRKQYKEGRSRAR